MGGSGMAGQDRRRFRAMGTDVTVAAVADPGVDLGPALDLAVATVHDLESRWSRFLPDSELSQINRADGPVVVSALTCDLVAVACDAWRASDGWFDPTVLPALEAAGYDRPFDLGLDRATPASQVAPSGCADIAWDRATGLVVLPSGCRLDLGGIAKGATADLITAQLVEAGAEGACASIGGDVRVRCRPGAEPWPVAASVADIEPIALLDGAVCSSSTLRRTWQRAGERHHHVIDPRSGCAASGWASEVAVTAGNAITAEMLTKVALIADEDTTEHLVGAHGAAAIVRRHDGRLRRIGSWPSMEVSAT